VYNPIPDEEPDVQLPPEHVERFSGPPSEELPLQFTVDMGQLAQSDDETVTGFCHLNLNELAWLYYVALRMHAETVNDQFPDAIIELVWSDGSRSYLRLPSLFNVIVEHGNEWVDGEASSDANGDCRVDEYDVVDLARLLAGGPGGAIRPSRADVNTDQRVDGLDLLLVLNEVRRVNRDAADD
jgi:hypothetical protein